MSTHHIPDDASSMSDDVFEDPETTQARIEELRRRPFGDGCYNPAPPTHHSSQQSLASTGKSIMNMPVMAPVQRTASPSGYPGYRPTREAMQMYAYNDAAYDLDDEYDDGWRSYRYDEVDMHPHPTQQVPPFDDTVNHKTILLGDSGVGKTSFLVKYNTGEFRLGSFSATVGIALTPTSPTGFRRQNMRRQQTRYRSDSIAAQLARTPSLTKSAQAAAAAGSGASPTRRESLVKPTWQHITPGQISTKTLDKINGIGSDDSDDDGYPKRRPSVIVHQRQQQCMQPPAQPLAQAQLQQQATASAGAAAAERQSNSGFMAKVQSARLAFSAGSGGGGGGGGDGGARAATGASGSRGSVGAALCAPPVAAVDTGGAGAGARGGGIDFESVTAGGTSVALCKTAGRALIRMISTGTSHDDDEDFDIMGKVIMLGDSGVGKTSLLLRFRDGRYVPSYFLSTVGIDFRNKVVVVDGTRVKLQIWDTAGQERFRSVTHAYYRDAHALLLLYDVTNKTTFDNIRAWLGEIREYAQEDVVIVLIGNKADCSSSERQVKREDGERLGREHNVPFMETSAKTGQNVELAFTAVARQLKCRGYDHGGYDEGKFNVHEYVRDNTKARSMCAQCRNM